MHVTIDARSKRDAEIIAAELPGTPPAGAVRGFGVIRLRFAGEREAHDVLRRVADCIERHGLGWARVRIDDAEHTFRGRRRPAA